MNQPTFAQRAVFLVALMDDLKLSPPEQIAFLSSVLAALFPAVYEEEQIALRGFDDTMKVVRQHIINGCQTVKLINHTGTQQ